ncbi:unnamed protein product [Effrenium voratum]|nr:unnamed protein product [Effrenium voratum]
MAEALEVRGPELSEEEEVQAPHSAKAARPGHLWAPEDLRSVVVEHHQEVRHLHLEVLQRLDDQDEMLRQLLPRTGPKAFFRFAPNDEYRTKDRAPLPAPHPSAKRTAAARATVDSKESVLGPVAPVVATMSAWDRSAASETSQNSKASETVSDRSLVRSAEKSAEKSMEITGEQVTGEMGGRSERALRPSARSVAGAVGRIRTTWNYFTNHQSEGSGRRPRFWRTFSKDEEWRKKCAESTYGKLQRGKFATKSQDTTMLNPNAATRLVSHPCFDVVFALLVLSNCIVIGVEVEMSLSGPTPFEMQVIQYMYTALFTLELAVRVASKGFSFFWDDDWAWNYFDILIVLASLWDVVMDIVRMSQEDGQTSISGSAALRALRVIRMTRILKTLRLVRIFRFIVALRTLVTSIFHTLKSLFWALVLLTLIMYLFAVLFTQAVNDYISDEDALPLSDENLHASLNYFGSLFETMLSLFMSIAGGVSWEDVVAPLKAISTMWVVVYLFYVSFTVFAVLNVVTGVFCQTAIESAQHDHALAVQNALANKEAHLHKINTLFNKLGGEESGLITYAQFEEGVDTVEVQEYFQTIGLDVLDAWSLFKLLDLDAGGSISIEEFFTGCLRLRGNAKAMDIAKVIHDQTWLVKNQGAFQQYMDKEMQSLNQQLRALRKMMVDLAS